ncbi:protein TRM32 [Euphorbia lathyris]|uniref:protein TRM32 n=1 Tax=Euphorbia lathyris TaxID=212925 RepID=UPI00331387E4
MGKNLQRLDSMVPMQNRNPGCMWGVLQIVKYHRWRLIKKRNSQKGVNPTGTGNERPDFNTPQQSERIPLLDSNEDDFYKKEKMKDSTPASKGSVRSRIKALISDDLHKKKAQLRRSTSYPALSQRSEPADENPVSAVTVKKSIPLDDLHLKNKAPTTTKNLNSSEDPDGMLTDNKLRHKHPDETTKESNENRNLVPRNSGRKQSLVHTREMLDALDLINTNKELLLKLLQDPSSPLVHQFHSEQALSSRRKFLKSTSFCSSSVSSMRGSSPIKLNPDQKGIASDAVEPKFVRQCSMPSIAPEYKRRNHVVMNRFKDLKHKLKYMIKQNNNENHRVAMDGILHKIPHGKEVPKDVKKDIVDNAKKQAISKDVKESDSPLPSPFKSGKRFNRTSSLKESLDRYSQLYETSFNRESKQTSKLRSEDATSPQVNISKTIRRILSSPDLNYLSYHSDDSPNVYTSPVRKSLDTDKNTEHSDTESQPKDTVDEVMIEPETNSGLVSDDPCNSVTTESAFPEKQDEIFSSETITETEEPDISVNDSKFPEDIGSPVTLSAAEDLKPSIGTDLPDTVDSSKDELAESVKETTIEPETIDGKMETPRKDLEFEAGGKDKAEFDYVRDILHLSGFSGSESLGTWHADDQPLDPSMLEEMDSIMFNSEFFGDEEGYPCYNLLLFDLINHVLMEIYAKSYTYYPSPLSSLSRIHPMPVGGRVFDEVWTNISWYLSFSPESSYQLLDYIARRDYSKSDEWMNLQFDSECVAMEVDDMIFDDLLDDMISDHLLEDVILI